MMPQPEQTPVTAAKFYEEFLKKATSDDPRYAAYGRMFDEIDDPEGLDPQQLWDTLSNHPKYGPGIRQAYRLVPDNEVPQALKQQPKQPAGPSTARQLATVPFQHGIEAAGGGTAMQAYELAGQSAKNLIERALGEPIEVTERNLPGLATAAKFAYGAGKLAPGIIDFMYTPAGAATAVLTGGLPGVGRPVLAQTLNRLLPEKLKPLLPAYFRTEMSRPAVEIVTGERPVTAENVGEAVAGAKVATGTSVRHPLETGIVPEARTSAAEARDMWQTRRARRAAPAPAGTPTTAPPPAAAGASPAEPTTEAPAAAAAAPGALPPLSKQAQAIATMLSQDAAREGKASVQPTDIAKTLNIASANGGNIWRELRLHGIIDKKGNFIGKTEKPPAAPAASGPYTPPGFNPKATPEQKRQWGHEQEFGGVTHRPNPIPEADIFSATGLATPRTEVPPTVPPAVSRDRMRMAPPPPEPPPAPEKAAAAAAGAGPTTTTGSQGEPAPPGMEGIPPEMRQPWLLTEDQFVQAALRMNPAAQQAEPALRAAHRQIVERARAAGLFEPEIEVPPAPPEPPALGEVDAAMQRIAQAFEKFLRDQGGADFTWNRPGSPEGINLGIVKPLMADVAIVAREVLRRTGDNFRAFRDAMIARFGKYGPLIEPHLMPLWHQAQKDVAVEDAARGQKEGASPLPPGTAPTAGPALPPGQPRQFASTQIDLGQIKERVRAIAGRIHPDDLAADGIVQDPHVTVKYGLHEDNPQAVAALLAQQGPVTGTIGPLEIFQTPEADVLVARVTSPSLNQLNQRLAGALPNTETYPEYKPHITVAYLKPGRGAEYLARIKTQAPNGHEIEMPRLPNPLQDVVFTANELTFSPRQGQPEALRFGAAPAPVRTVDPTLFTGKEFRPQQAKPPASGEPQAGVYAYVPEVPPQIGTPLQSSAVRNVQGAGLKGESRNPMLAQPLEKATAAPGVPVVIFRGHPAREVDAGPVFEGPIPPRQILGVVNPQAGESVADAVRRAGIDITPRPLPEAAPESAAEAQRRMRDWQQYRKDARQRRAMEIMQQAMEAAMNAGRPPTERPKPELSEEEIARRAERQKYVDAYKSFIQQQEERAQQQPALDAAREAEVQRMIEAAREEVERLMREEEVARARADELLRQRAAATEPQPEAPKPEPVFLQPGSVEPIQRPPSDEPVWAGQQVLQAGGFTDRTVRPEAEPNWSKGPNALVQDPAFIQLPSGATADEVWVRQTSEGTKIELQRNSKTNEFLAYDEKNESFSDGLGLNDLIAMVNRVNARETTVSVGRGMYDALTTAGFTLREYKPSPELPAFKNGVKPTQVWVRQVEDGTIVIEREPYLGLWRATKYYRKGNWPTRVGSYETLPETGESGGPRVGNDDTSLVGYLNTVLRGEVGVPQPQRAGGARGGGTQSMGNSLEAVPGEAPNPRTEAVNWLAENLRNAQTPEELLSVIKEASDRLEGKPPAETKPTGKVQPTARPTLSKEENAELNQKQRQAEEIAYRAPDVPLRRQESPSAYAGRQRKEDAKAPVRERGVRPADKPMVFSGEDYRPSGELVSENLNTATGGKPGDPQAVTGAIVDILKARAEKGIPLKLAEPAPPAAGPATTAPPAAPTPTRPGAAPPSAPPAQEPPTGFSIMKWDERSWNVVVGRRIPETGVVAPIPTDIHIRKVGNFYQIFNGVQGGAGFKRLKEAEREAIKLAQRVAEAAETGQPVPRKRGRPKNEPGAAPKKPGEEGGTGAPPAPPTPPPPPPPPPPSAPPAAAAVKPPAPEPKPPAPAAAVKPPAPEAPKSEAPPTTRKARFAVGPDGKLYDEITGMSFADWQMQGQREAAAKAAGAAPPAATPQPKPETKPPVAKTKPPVSETKPPVTATPAAAGETGVTEPLLTALTEAGFTKRKAVGGDVIFTGKKKGLQVRASGDIWEVEQGPNADALRVGTGADELRAFLSSMNAPKPAAAAPTPTPAAPTPPVPPSKPTNAVPTPSEPPPTPAPKGETFGTETMIRQNLPKKRVKELEAKGALPATTPPPAAAPTPQPRLIEHFSTGAKNTKLVAAAKSFWKKNPNATPQQAGAALKAKFGEQFGNAYSDNAFTEFAQIHQPQASTPPPAGMLLPGFTYTATGSGDMFGKGDKLTYLGRGRNGKAAFRDESGSLMDVDMSDADLLKVLKEEPPPQGFIKSESGEFTPGRVPARIRELLGKLRGQKPQPSEEENWGVDRMFTKEGRVRTGAAIPQLGKTLGSSLYEGDRVKIITRELIQNASDAIRGVPNATVDLTLDEKKGEITIKDTGRGMTREQFGTVFVDLAGSGKRDQQDATGGFGVGNAAPQMMSKEFEATTVNEGVTANGQRVRMQYTLKGTPDDLLSERGITMESKRVPLSTPTGTTVRVVLDKSRAGNFWNAKSFAEDVHRSIAFPGKFTATYIGQHDWQGTSPIEGPTRPPLRKLGVEQMPSGTVTLYASDEKPAIDLGVIRVEVNNNGIYALNHGIWAPGTTKLKGVPSVVAVDVQSAVPEGHPDYPFTMSREHMRDDVKKAVRDYVTREILNPAVQRFNNYIQDRYDNVPRMASTQYNIPMYDVGGKFTPEETEAMRTDPTMIRFAENINRVADALIKKLKGNPLSQKTQFDTTPGLGQKTRQVGVVFQGDGAWGLYITDPRDRGESGHERGGGMLLVNPFAFSTSPTGRSTGSMAGVIANPDQAAAMMWYVLKHELLHDAIKRGHPDPNWVVGEVEMSTALGAKFEIEALNRLKEAYAGPAAITGSGSQYVGSRVGATPDYSPEFKKALRVYTESRRRPASEEDPLGGEALVTGGPAPDGGGPGAGPGGVPAGGAGSVRGGGLPAGRAGSGGGGGAADERTTPPPVKGGENRSPFAKFWQDESGEQRPPEDWTADTFKAIFDFGREYLKKDVLGGHDYGEFANAVVERFGHRMSQFIPFLWDKVRPPIPKPEEINAMDLPTLKEAKKQIDLEFRQHFPATWWKEVHDRQLRGKPLPPNSIADVEHDTLRAELEGYGVNGSPFATKEQLQAELAQLRKGGDPSLPRHESKYWPNLSTRIWDEPRKGAGEIHHALLDGILKAALQGNMKGVEKLAQELGPMVEDVGRIFPALKPLVELLDRSAQQQAKTAKGEPEKPGMTRRSFVQTTAGAAAAAPKAPAVISKALAKTAIDKIRDRIWEFAPGLPVKITQGELVTYWEPGERGAGEEGYGPDAVEFVFPGGKRKMQPKHPKDVVSEPGVSVETNAGWGSNYFIPGTAEEVAKQDVAKWQDPMGDRDQFENPKWELEQSYDDMLGNVRGFLDRLRRQARMKNLRGAWLHITRRMDDLKRHPEKQVAVPKPAVPKTTPPPSRREIAAKFIEALAERKPKPPAAAPPPKTEPPPQLPQGEPKKGEKEKNADRSKGPGGVDNEGV